MANNNKDNVENQLNDVAPNGKIRPWKEKKMSSLELAESYKRLGMLKKSYRVKGCGTVLEFKRLLQDDSLKLNRANFCKVRLCPMCAWRRSNKIYAQVSKVMNKALEEQEYRFLFLTLTCKNINPNELTDSIDSLFKAYNLLTKRKEFKKAIKGWFRGLEVTHNLEQDTYHPHFHVILMVNKSYFKKLELYMNQKDWTSIWKSCLGVDYTPIVDIRAFKATSKTQMAKSLSESAKYTVKDNDYLIAENEVLTDASVSILDLALAGRRLVAFGGELRRIHKVLNLDDMEKGDLVNTGEEEEIREDVSYIIECYKWHIGYKQHIKVDKK